MPSPDVAQPLVGLRHLASLERALRAYEETYGIESAEFYELRHSEDDPRIAAVPRFHRHAWASFYRDCKRLAGQDLAEHVRHEIEYA